MKKIKAFGSIGVCVKWCSHHGKQHGRLSKLLTKELPWNPLTSLLGTESSFIISGGIGFTTKHRHQNLLMLESLHLSSLSKESTCADLISCRSNSPEKRCMLYPSQLVKSLCAQIVNTEGPTVSLLFLFNLPISEPIQFKPAGSKGQPYVQMEWNSVSLRVISASPCSLQHLSRR